MRSLLTCYLLFIFSSLFCQNAGEADLTFGNNGVIRTIVKQSSCITALDIQKNGAIVGGGFSQGGADATFLTVVQYDINGNIDSSFAHDGVFTFIPPGYRVERQTDLKIQSDGKILACGELFGETGSNNYGYNFGIYRLLQNGTLDTTFNHTGIIIDYAYSKNSSCYVAGIALQNDDKIVIAGTSYNDNASDNYVYIARYNRNGSADSGFNTNGMVKIDPGSYDGRCSINKVLIQNDNKIIVFGKLNVNSNFYIMRINENGTIDNSFGIAGVVQFKIYNYMNTIYEAAITPDNKIFIAGISEGDYVSKGLIAKFNQDGTFDSTFNQNGMMISNDCNFKTFLLRNDGSFYSECDITLYDKSGVVDSNFGQDGTVQSLCEHPKLLLQRDGKLIIGGGYDDHIRLERYAGNPISDPFAANHTFYAFPNPFTDNFYIKFYEQPQLPYVVSISDILGNLVYEKTITELYNIQHILLNSMIAKGLYIISINDGISNKTAKIIHQ